MGKKLGVPHGFLGSVRQGQDIHERAVVGKFHEGVVEEGSPQKVVEEDKSQEAEEVDKRDYTGEAEDDLKRHENTKNIKDKLCILVFVKNYHRSSPFLTATPKIRLLAGIDLSYKTYKSTKVL